MSHHHQRNDLSALLRSLEEENNPLYHKCINYVSAAARHANHVPPQTNRIFTPNFDVCETDDAYFLEGELPGIKDKSKVSTEFIDGQTLVIGGMVERSTVPRIDELERFSSPKLQPGVENAVGDDDSPFVKTVPPSFETRRFDSRPKFWVTERTIGKFQRRFTFPAPIDLDKVTAGLEDGLLRIVVPKMHCVVRRKIAVQ